VHKKLKNLAIAVSLLMVIQPILPLLPAPYADAAEMVAGEKVNDEEMRAFNPQAQDAAEREIAKKEDSIVSGPVKPKGSLGYPIDGFTCGPACDDRLKKISPDSTDVSIVKLSPGSVLPNVSIIGITSGNPDPQPIYGEPIVKEPQPIYGESVVKDPKGVIPGDPLVGCKLQYGLCPGDPDIFHLLTPADPGMPAQDPPFQLGSRIKSTSSDKAKLKTGTDPIGPPDTQKIKGETDPLGIPQVMSNEKPKGWQSFPMPPIVVNPETPLTQDKLNKIEKAVGTLVQQSLDEVKKQINDLKLTHPGNPAPDPAFATKLDKIEKAADKVGSGEQSTAQRAQGESTTQQVNVTIRAGDDRSDYTFKDEPSQISIRNKQSPNFNIIIVNSINKSTGTINIKTTLTNPGPDDSPNPHGRSIERTTDNQVEYNTYLSSMVNSIDEALKRLSPFSSQRAVLRSMKNKVEKFRIE